VAIAPFERVLVSVPGGLTLTTVEAAMLVSLGAGLWMIGHSRARDCRVVARSPSPASRSSQLSCSRRW
jgi:hypothetical protein